MRRSARQSIFHKSMRHILAAMLATTFWVCWFAVIPLKLIELNHRWGWPDVSNPLLQFLGLTVMSAAVVTVLYCCLLFGRVGKGTPVPGDPPKRLVSTGLYKYTRNPIYLAYVGLLLGQFLFFGSLTLFVYASVSFVGFYLAIVWIEEPVLLRRFGDDYAEFSRRVPRWIGFRNSAPL